MQILIHGGRVIDPGNINGVRDILIDNGIITDIVESGKIPHLHCNKFILLIAGVGTISEI